MGIFNNKPVMDKEPDNVFVIHPAIQRYIESIINKTIDSKIEKQIIKITDVKIKEIIDVSTANLEDSLFERIYDPLAIQINLMIAHTFRILIKNMHTLNFKDENLDMIYKEICLNNRLPDLIEKTVQTVFEFGFRKAIDNFVKTYIDSLIKKGSLIRVNYVQKENSENPTCIGIDKTKTEIKK